MAGAIADALGYGVAVAFVAALTAASGAWVLIDMRGGGWTERGEWPRSECRQIR